MEERGSTRVLNDGVKEVLPNIYAHRLNRSPMNSRVRKMTRGASRKLVHDEGLKHNQ